MDQKTSLLIPRQVPSFVSEEYPLFVTFLEAYYEFLENKQGTNKNDLSSRAKSLKTIFDVDKSIDEFQDYFFSTYASLIPVDIQGNKELLIKNILPLYQAKGSENSFKLLFRFLFAEEPVITYPKDNILRASSGEWRIDNTIKVSTRISSYYTADGNTKIFPIITQVPETTIDVYLNGVLTTTGYKALTEYNIIEFDSNPSLNTFIEFFYNTAEITIFNNRKITGNNSGASAIINRIFRRTFNNQEIFELYVDKSTIDGVFEIGEVLNTNLFVNETLVNLSLKTFSQMNSITITKAGSGYNVGDPISVTSLRAVKNPQAIVSKVTTGSIDSIQIIKTGAGFKVGNAVTADGLNKPFVDIDVSSVNLTSNNSANTFRIFSDIISDIDPGNTYISAASYGLTGVYTGNVNTVIRHTLSSVSFSNIGEISDVIINSVLNEFSTIPTFDVQSANISIANIGSTIGNTTVYIGSYGSLGKTIIHDGGTGYSRGDELVFTNAPGNYGLGAAAEVTRVSTGGTIEKIEFVPMKITGTANVFTVNANVIGTGTQFETELVSGDQIMINNEVKLVGTIYSNTLMSVDSVFSSDSVGKPVRLYGLYLIGGQNYEQDKLPTITISTSGGSNANVQVEAIMGDGEEFVANVGSNVFGSITETIIIDPGEGLKSVPGLDFSAYGDGNAEAEASINPMIVELPGKWINQKGLISSSYMKLQGKDYYIDYSYVISSTVEFKKYKKILKDLLHPAGLIAYSEILKVVDFAPQEIQEIKVASEISLVPV